MENRWYTQDNLNRIIANTTFTGTCWLWNGYKVKGGYGRATINNLAILVHVASYEMFNGNIPKGYEIDHTCKITNCLNPDHLEAVTPMENVRRSNGLAAKKHEQTHCKHGHEFTEANTYLYKRGNSITRSCRACHNRITNKRIN